MNTQFYLGEKKNVSKSSIEILVCYFNFIYLLEMKENYPKKREERNKRLFF